MIYCMYKALMFTEMIRLTDVLASFKKLSSEKYHSFVISCSWYLVKQ